MLFVSKLSLCECLPITLASSQLDDKAFSSEATDAAVFHGSHDAGDCLLWLLCPLSSAICNLVTGDATILRSNE